MKNKEVGGEQNEAGNSHIAVFKELPQAINEGFLERSVLVPFPHLTEQPIDPILRSQLSGDFGKRPSVGSLFLASFWARGSVYASSQHLAQYFSSLQ